MENFIQKNQILTGLIFAGFIVGSFVYLSGSDNNFDVLSKKIELSDKPNYLFDESFHPNKVSVYGVSINDPESKIDNSVISEQKNSAGWIHTKHGVGYRISNGRVVEIILQKEEVRRIGILREDEIPIRFGKPDKVEEGAGLIDTREYFYADRGILVRYGSSSRGMRINIIGKSDK